MILDFDENLIGVQSKTSKTIGLPRKLQNISPKQALITIQKSFARPYVYYGNVIYDQDFDLSFYQKLEKIQYDACTAITGTICGTSKEKIYQKLGLLSLERRKLCFFFKD